MTAHPTPPRQDLPRKYAASPHGQRWLLLVLLMALLPALSGCAPALYRIGMPFVYKAVELPAAQQHHGLAYRAGGHPKHHLNLFVPDTAAFPVVVFVHGGGWTEGDRDLAVGGKDIYNNIGRYLARHGIGVAVISYRLLPTVPWPSQVEDVAAATAWVYSHIADYGGDPQRLFLMGHSAGAQLSARVALDPAPLRAQGVPAEAICGVLPVSAAALDLADERTYELGFNPDYYARRFGANSPEEDWQHAASPITYVTPDAPPFQLFYATGEGPGFARQATVLHEALQAAGAPSRLTPFPARSHARGVLSLSRDDQEVGPAVRRFVAETTCSDG